MRDKTLKFQAETQLPTEFGSFRFLVYKNEANEEVIAVATREVELQSSAAVRIHSACFTAEAIGSLKCDCKQQLDYALSYIAKHGGIVIYLPQEGRGIGLSNKIRAYAMQENGHDTIEANTILGLPVDDRCYDDAAYILNDLGIDGLKLITNNPLKLKAMKDLGLNLIGRISVPAIPNCHSHQYIETKRSKMGHMFNITTINKEESESPQGIVERPFIHVNLAMNQAGHMNQVDGQPINLSCNKDWQRVHQLRERNAAVVVGARTWALDNPRLTVRPDCLGRQPQRQPDRVIFAGRTQCNVATDSRRSFVVGIKDNDSGDCIKVNADDRDLKSPLESLFKHGLDTLLIEGGMTLIRSFIKQKMVDRFTIYVSVNSHQSAIKTVARALPELPIALMHIVPFGEGILLSLNARDLVNTQAPNYPTSTLQTQTV